MAVDEHHISVVGMSCEHCRCRVERALEAVPGVVRVVIDLETGNASIECEPGATSREALIEAVEEAGYSAGSMSTP
jgi:copper chaperone CopZ